MYVIYLLSIHITLRLEEKATHRFDVVFLSQQACGFEYTSKLQRMFQDIGVSKDLNDKFKSHLTNTEPLDCKFSSIVSVSLLCHLVVVVVSLFMVSDSFLLPMLLSGLHHPGFEFRILALPTVSAILSTSRGKIAVVF